MPVFDHLSIQPDPKVLEAARTLTPLLSAEAESGETGRTMTQAAVDAVAGADLFWVLIPRELGGLGADMTTTLAVFEELAYADGAAGWSVMASATATAFASIFLEGQGLDDLFGGDRRPITAGMFGPIGEGRRSDAGIVVDGSYRFGSGTAHADWIAAGVMEMDGDEPALTASGLPAMTVTYIPRDQIEWLDNWHVMGLKGTGSYDYRVDGVLVPARRSFSLLEATPLRGGPALGIGLFGITASGHAAFALGVGRRALDEIVEIARTKERLGADPIARQQLFQHEFALHDAAVRAAHSYVYESFAVAERAVARGGAPTNSENQRMRQATTWATRVVADACRFAYTWAGSDGLKDPSAVQRCFRDISAGTQHLFVDNNTLTGYTDAVLGEA